MRSRARRNRDSGRTFEMQPLSDPRSILADNQDELSNVQRGLQSRLRRLQDKDSAYDSYPPYAPHPSPEWQIHQDSSSGREYYFNPRTMQIQWEKPAELLYPPKAHPTTPTPALAPKTTQPEMPASASAPPLSPVTSQRVTQEEINELTRDLAGNLTFSMGNDEIPTPASPQSHSGRAPLPIIPPSAYNTGNGYNERLSDVGMRSLANARSPTTRISAKGHSPGSRQKTRRKIQTFNNQGIEEQPGWWNTYVAKPFQKTSKKITRWQTKREYGILEEKYTSTIKNLNEAASLLKKESKKIVDLFTDERGNRKGRRIGEDKLDETGEEYNIKENLLKIEEIGKLLTGEIYKLEIKFAYILSNSDAFAEAKEAHENYAEAKNIADRTWEASHPDQLVSNNGWLWGGEKYASAVDSKMGFWEPSNYNKDHPEHVGNPEVTWNKEGRGGTTKLYKNIKTRTKGWFENNKNVGNSIWGWGGRMRKTKNKKVKKK